MVQTGFLRQVINNHSQENIEGPITKGNPKIDFFKRVYYRYYNFSTQSFNIPCKGQNHLDFNTETTFICTLGNKADLLGKMYLNIELPKVISNDKIKLRYIKNIGLGIIKNIDFKIKGETISRLDGQKIFIMNKLLNDIPNARIGHKHIDIPLSNMKYSNIYTDKLYNAPIDVSNERLIIPLPFGLSKHTSLYFPTFLYKTDDIEIHVTLRALEELYTVEIPDKDYWYYAKENMDQNVPIYTIPDTFEEFRKDAIDNTDVSLISNYPTYAFGEQTKYKSNSNNNSPFYLRRYESRKVSIPDITVDSQNIKKYIYKPCTKEYPTSTTPNYNVQCSIEADFIFLDSELKRKFYDIYMYSYLFTHCIEDTTHKDKQYLGKETVQIHINSPMASIILGIQRSDNASRNEWLNFTNYEDSTLTEKKILKYQDNWWYSAISATKIDVSGTVTTQGGTAILTIKPDNFQEFIFRHGPYGETVYMGRPIPPPVLPDPSIMTFLSGETTAQDSYMVYGDPISIETLGIMGTLSVGSATMLNDTLTVSNISTSNILTVSDTEDINNTVTEWGSNFLFIYYSPVLTNVFIPSSNCSTEGTHTLPISTPGSTGWHRYQRTIPSDTDANTIASMGSWKYHIERDGDYDVRITLSADACNGHGIDSVLGGKWSIHNSEMNKTIAGSLLWYAYGTILPNPLLTHTGWVIDSVTLDTVHLYHTVTIHINSGPYCADWVHSIRDNESLYTLEDIHEFRSTWKYRDAIDIPEINRLNFYSTWKESPLNTMEILFNNNVREDTKPSIYYNTLQPYMYSKHTLDPGLFLYSFNLDLNNIQPHGSYQLPSVLRFDMKVDVNRNQIFDTTSNAFTITPYALCYNIIQLKKDTFSLLYYNY